jgi:hypothetical protein
MSDERERLVGLLKLGPGAGWISILDAVRQLVIERNALRASEACLVAERDALLAKSRKPWGDSKAADAGALEKMQATAAALPTHVLDQLMASQADRVAEIEARTGESHVLGTRSSALLERARLALRALEDEAERRRRTAGGK